jgi:hypothetical protein
MLELAGGTAAGLGLGIVGGIVSVPFNPCGGTSDNDSARCLTPIILGLGGGAALGVALGVYGAGHILRGKGGYLPTLFGTVLGASLGVALALSTQDAATAAVGLTLGPLGGAIVAFELSHASWVEDQLSAPQLSEGRVQMIPSFGLTPRGGVFGGLAGRF